MKKILICLLVACMLFSQGVSAANNYKIVDMSKFEKIGMFSEGLCAAQDPETQRWGFVDVNKNWVIKPQYMIVSQSFKNGVCGVTNVNGEYVIINHQNEVLYKSSTRGFTDIINHGDYRIGYSSAYGRGVSLLDKNYNLILDAELSTFGATGYSPDVSSVFFKSGNNEQIYNYKGVDITTKVINEKSKPILANNKYLLCLGGDNEKRELHVYDVDGNEIATFDSPTGDDRDIGLVGDLVFARGNYINTVIYNIPQKKRVFLGEEDGYAYDLKFYYNKYFTVQRFTTALYSVNGDILVDFGKWDWIYPSSVSNNIVVANGKKYGIADYSGNLLLPMEYEQAQSTVIDGSGKYALLKKGVDSCYYIDMSSLKTNYHWTGWGIGVDKYIIRDTTIMDNNFNSAYILSDGYKFNGVESIGNGIVRLYKNSGSKKEYAFLIFNDCGGVKVNLDGKTIAFDQLPLIKNGRTLVPMRAIFEALGATVEWHNETQSITAKKGNTTIQMQIGKNSIVKDGKSIAIDVAPNIVGGRTLVPVRAISDCFNIGVDWDNYTQTVSLFTN